MPPIALLSGDFLLRAAIADCRAALRAHQLGGQRCTCTRCAGGRRFLEAAAARGYLLESDL